jgi:hypothetical protein
VLIVEPAVVNIRKSWRWSGKPINQSPPACAVGARLFLLDRRRADCFCWIAFVLMFHRHFLLSCCCVPACQPNHPARGADNMLSTFSFIFVDCCVVGACFVFAAVVAKSAMFLFV